MCSIFFLGFAQPPHQKSNGQPLNLGETRLRIARELKTADLILGEVVYIAIIYHIPDS